MRTLLYGTLLALTACGGGRGRAAVAGPPPELIRQLEVPENPYRIIYSPPVNLAKTPDTTAHARKAKS